MVPQQGWVGTGPCCIVKAKGLLCLVSTEDRHFQTFSFGIFSASALSPPLDRGPIISSVACSFDAPCLAKVNPILPLSLLRPLHLHPFTLSSLPARGLPFPPMSPHIASRLLAAALVAAIGIDVPSSAAQDVHVRVSPDVKTGIEGTTEFPTIQMAMDHHPFAGVGPDGKPGRVFIEIAPGIYHERVIVTQNHTNITLIGMGASPSDVVFRTASMRNRLAAHFSPRRSRSTATGFEADNLTFENAAGNTGQAVAIAVRADRAIFKHCRFLGHQDTLFADYGRQYYVDSYIEGGVDFIFGNAAAVFDRSEIHANAPGWLTAQSRTSPEQATGYVILNSRVTSSIEHLPAEQGTTALASAPSSAGGSSSASASPPHVVASTPPAADSAFSPSGSQKNEVTSLGRPWRPYSRVVYINTWLCADVTPQGWNAWGKTPGTPLAWYAEFNSTGPGANPAARVPWSHQLTAAEAEQFKPKVFLAGVDHWDPESDAAKLP